MNRAHWNSFYFEVELVHQRGVDEWSLLLGRVVRSARVGLVVGGHLLVHHGQEGHQVVVLVELVEDLGQALDEPASLDRVPPGVKT